MTLEIKVYDEQNLKWMTARKSPNFESIVNRLGALAAKARGTLKPVTTFNRLIESEAQQKLFICFQCGEECDGTVNDDCPKLIAEDDEEWRAIGFLRTTRQKLYVRDRSAAQTILFPLCIVDGYIHSTLQRRGIGLYLFQYAMDNEQTNAAQSAYDNPSTALLAFLAKHFGLERPIRQSTNFVVFDDVFKSASIDDNAATNAKLSDVPADMKTAREQREDGNDCAKDLIRDDKQVAPLPSIDDADTPRGRKLARDYQHTNIF